MDFNNTSDFVSGFWNMYVIVLVLASVLGCAVFLLIQDRAKASAGNTTGHTWDETLQEYNNPLPNWWRWMFYITIVFSLVYLALYPGLGNIAGNLGWTMRGQYDAEMKKADAQYGPLFNKFLQMDVKAVAANKEAKDMGARMFQTYCASCHGSDARGAVGFPNLTDKYWLWGGTPEKIKETITAGRTGVMTPKGTKPDMSADDVKDLANYVRSLSGLTADPIRVARGRELFPQACAACHGADARGNPDAGYPNLTNKTASTWLYGSSEATLIDGITKGHTNQMPAFGEFLGPAKVHLLTAYVWGLSNDATGAQTGMSGMSGMSGMAGMSGMNAK